MSGVDDSTASLRDALPACGVEAQPIGSEDWRIPGARKVRESQKRYNLAHIPYPLVALKDACKRHRQRRITGNRLLISSFGHKV